MTTYTTSVLIMGRVVMGGYEVEAETPAETPAEARAICERKFWSDANNLRAEAETMDEVNRAAALRFAAAMDETLAQARRWGVTVEARKTRRAA